MRPLCRFFLFAFFVLGTASAFAQPSAWTPPQAIDTGQSSEPALALNARGDVLVAWKRNDDSIAVAARSSDGAWGLPVLLNGDSGVSVDAPTAGLAGDGEAIVAWQRQETSDLFPPTLPRLVARVLKGIWQPAQTVDYVPPEPNVGAAGVPEIAMNEAGQGVLAFQEALAYGFVDRGLYVDRFVPGRGMSAPQRIDACAVRGTQSVAINAAGDAMAAYDSAACRRASHARVALIDSDGRVSVTDLHDRIPAAVRRGRDMQTTGDMASSGDVLAVWVHGNVIYGNAYSRVRHAWGAQSRPIEQNASGEASVHPQVKFEAPDRAFAVWEDVVGDTHSLHYAVFLDGRWSGEGVIDTQGDARNPVLAVNAQGLALVVWQRRLGDQHDLYVSRYANGRWEAPATLDQSPDDATDATLAVDPSGNAITVWVAGADIWVSSLGK